MCVRFVSVRVGGLSVCVCFFSVLSTPYRALNSPLALYDRCMRLVKYTHFLPASWRIPAGMYTPPPPFSSFSFSPSAAFTLMKKKLNLFFPPSSSSPPLPDFVYKSKLGPSLSPSSSALPHPLAHSVALNYDGSYLPPHLLGDNRGVYTPGQPSAGLSLLPPLPPRTAPSCNPFYGGMVDEGVRVGGGDQDQGVFSLGAGESDLSGALPSASASSSRQVTGVGVQHKMVIRSFCSSFYGLRIACLLEELIAVLATPILLWWFMPKICDDVCDFLLASTVSTPFGDLCCFASLDVDTYGSPFYTPTKADTEPPTCPASVGAVGASPRRALSYRHQHEKKKKSERAERKTKKGEVVLKRTSTQRQGAGTSARLASSLLDAEGKKKTKDEEEEDLTSGGRTRRSSSRDERSSFVSWKCQKTRPLLSERQGSEPQGGRKGGWGSSPRGERGGEEERARRRSIRTTSGKTEKSAITFVLTYRIPPPYDDTSPLWAVFASDSLTSSIAVLANSSSSSSVRPGQKTAGRPRHLSSGKQTCSSSSSLKSSSLCGKKRRGWPRGVVLLSPLLRLVFL